LQQIVELVIHPTMILFLGSLQHTYTPLLPYTHSAPNRYTNQRRVGRLAQLRDRGCPNFRMGGMPSRPGGFMSE